MALFGGGKQPGIFHHVDLRGADLGVTENPLRRIKYH